MLLVNERVLHLFLKMFRGNIVPAGISLATGNAREALYPFYVPFFVKGVSVKKHFCRAFTRCRCYLPHVAGSTAQAEQAARYVLLFRKRTFQVQDPDIPEIDRLPLALQGNIPFR